MTTTPPEAIPLVIDNVPDELATVAHWVVWCWEKRTGKWTKVPVNAASGARASSTDPSTWSAFEKAVRYARRNLLPGVGFVFTGSPFAGADLDGCRDPETGRLEEGAQEIISGLDSYAEVSPSGTGVKIFVRGMLPPGRKRKGRIEMYDSGRFFTVTGHRLPGMPSDVLERGTELVALHRRVFGPAPERQAYARSTDPPGGTAIDDAELVSRARSAANGEKFARLWSGDTGDYANGDNEGRSEADLALCSLLAFWVGPDEARVDRLFRQSGLYRKKWERADYRALTLAAALNREEFWSGDSVLTPGRGKVYARRRGAISLD